MISLILFITILNQISALDISLLSISFGASIGAYGSCGSIWKNSLVESFEAKVYNTTVHGFIQNPPDSKDLLVLSFRGTHGFAQLESEFTHILLKPKLGFELKGIEQNFLVQDYFVNSANALWDIMKDRIQKRLSSKIVIAGHSLGGAIASLIALRVLTEFNIHPSVYSFGEPRVGDYNFSVVYDKLISDSWRVVHHNDAVAHLPACQHTITNILECNPVPGANYHHGKEIFFPLDDGVYAYDQLNSSVEIKLNSYKICDKNEDRSCADGVGLPYSINQHITYFGLPLGDTGRKLCGDVQTK